MSGEGLSLDTDDLEMLRSNRRWRDGAALIRGEFLEGFSVANSSDFENWLARERLRWRSLSVDTLVTAAQESLDAADPVAATDFAIRALELEPGSEPGICFAMRSMALQGNPAGAVELFATFERELSDLGVGPSAATLELHDRIKHERQWHFNVVPGGSEKSRPQRSPLIGRQRELADLIDLWTSCRNDPRPALAVIESDPGTGKTRLAEEILDRARLDGAVTATVRAIEADTDAPWSGLVGLARGGLLSAPGVAATDPAAIAGLAAVVPEWASRFAGTDHPGPPHPTSRALGAALEAVAEEQPVVLLLDDAHWLDRDSLLALHSAIRDLEGHPLFVCINHSAAHRRDEIEAMRARVGRDVTGATCRL